ncbi:MULTISPECIES: hypothetical protein [unclassified Cellvibrio]|jgi:hypothetical protein|uniref:hypothetical protein n=1 Tax=unclassified Cellvibrio TaxID=2624793 RepID=UPI001247AD32|nr:MULTISPECIES: hypothetical protein [unclassified Cellvibrio]QEY11703.1 hypothetical protein D0B88_05105 [Cellvibrio sp. KY-YJ-3]UUA71883.1 hypothetical protein NNX04_15855 [Cellvibrio sp. QJXJ]
MKSSIKKMGLVIAAAGLFGSVNVLANSPISYNYAALQFVNQDIDDSNCDQDGLRLSGSLELNSDFFAVGSFSDLSDGRCGAEALSVGIGYHTLFGADSSLYGTLSVENVDIDHYDSDSGIVAAVGLRGFINQQVEAKAQLAHHTAFDGNTVLSGGLAYWFARNFAATADVGLGTEASEIALGVRMNF